MELKDCDFLVLINSISKIMKFFPFRLLYNSINFKEFTIIHWPYLARVLIGKSGKKSILYTFQSFYVTTIVN